MLLFGAYCKTVNDYFCVSNIGGTTNCQITFLFFCVEVYWSHKICIFVLYLSLNFQSKILLGRLSPEKNLIRKNTYSEFCIP